ncbi:hypothetical protein, partial [Thermococcus sp. GR5]|uniref:hypothetical protein n=1 Tax=Thermococcus sp. GR5 TaxID=1638255 RepID=UPI00198035F7
CVLNSLFSGGVALKLACFKRVSFISALRALSKRETCHKEQVKKKPPLKLALLKKARHLPPALKLLKKASPKARSSRSKAQRKKILLRKSSLTRENQPKQPFQRVYFPLTPFGRRFKG